MRLPRFLIFTAIPFLVGSWPARAATLNEAPTAPPPGARRSALAAPAEAAAASGGFTLNPTSREASRLFFRTVYAASDGVADGWTGDVATGVAGTTSAAFQDAVQLRVNYFRAMAGVPAAITFDPTYNAKAQKAALMMSANDDLSHTPPPTWKFYSADGAEAAGKSDIFLGYHGPRAMTGYMEDFGSGNAEAGHRRWLFYPQTRKMGTGDIPPDGTSQPANALWVVTPDYGTTRPAVRDQFVAWPPPGFVPYPLVFPRWSFSYPGATFTNTTVTMQRGGVSVPLTVQSRGAGAGEDAVVWVWDGLNADNEMATPQPPAADTPVQVAVNGVVIGGQSRNFSYTVTIFDPARTGVDTQTVAVTGPSQPGVAVNNTYACSAVALADSYQFRTAKIAALTAIEGAESGTGKVTVDAPPGAAVISSTYHASGAKSFHLATPDFGAESLTLNRTVLAGTGATLTFKTRFGYATPQQVARAQVSTDDGLSWDTLFTSAGTNAADAGFTSRSISLAAYAGRALRVRFVFSYDGGGPAYVDPAENIGWFVDDIAFTDAEELTDLTTAAASASTGFTFTPTAAGSYAVQARGGFFGGHLSEWGPALEVAAVQVGTSPIAHATGTYRGLVRSTPARHEWNGLVTLAVTTNGAFTGQAVLGGTKFPLRGTFDGAGVARFGTASVALLPRAGKPPLALHLHLPTGSDTPMRVLGEVSESDATVATLDAQRAVFSVAKTPVPPLRALPPAWSGPFTADLTLDPATPIATLAGRGWITATVSRAGSARFTGALADGTRWTSAQPLAVDGSVPIFASLYGGKGAVFGEVQLSATAPVTLTSTVDWFRPANLPGARFTAGWPDGVRLVLDGAGWTPFVVKKSWPLPGLAATSGGAHLWARAGGLPADLDWNAQVSLATGRVAITATPAGSSATLSWSASTGKFTGSFKTSAKATPLSFSGVLNSRANRARGYFLAPTAGGAITLLVQ